MSLSWGGFLGSCWGYNSNVGIKAFHYPKVIGGSSFGIFGGGNDIRGIPLSIIAVYTYSSNTAATGGILNFIGYDGSATSTGAMGVFGGGMATNLNFTSYFYATAIYWYSSNYSVSGTNLSYAAEANAAAGNATIGVFGGGYDLASGGQVSTTSIYIYSTNADVVGANLAITVGGLAAAGNAVMAVFGGDGYNTVSNITTYSYNTNISVIGSSLTNAPGYLGATGNSVMAVFGGGYDNTSNNSSVTHIYTYSSGMIVSGTTLAYFCGGNGADGSAISSGDVGVFGNNIDPTSYAQLSNTSVYYYDTNVVLSGGNLTSAISNSGTASGCGPTPSVNIDNTIYAVPPPLLTSGFGLFSTNTSLPATLTNIYMYSSDAVISGTNLTTIASYVAATSNATTGLVGGGTTTVGVISTTTLYRYSSNVVSAGGNLSYLNTQMAAVGNSAVGIFGGGVN